MKSFMNIEEASIILYFIEKVLDLKKFIQEGIVDIENVLLRHTKAQQFNFYFNANECLVMKYKLLHMNDD